MGRGVAQKLIESHLASGELSPDAEIGLRVDQTLTQDATGTLVMLELEHAVIAPRYLGLCLVIAKSYARIHWQNLVNFGVLPLEFTSDADYQHIDPGDELVIERVHDALVTQNGITACNRTKSASYSLTHRLSPRQVDVTWS